MPSAKFLRESICNVIASSASVGKQEEKTLEVELDNILNNFFHRSDNDNNSTATDKDKDNDDNVTPLMLACDKCCLDALVYIRDRFERATSNNDDNIQLKQLIEAFGHPTEESSCGNTAAHHALASGLVGGINILEIIWGYIEETESFQSTRLDRYLSLLSLTNHNGDTPLMMACVSGNVNTIRQIMEYSNILAIASNSEMVVKTWLPSRIFDNVNNENFTALNLACGHGQIDVVKFLIEPGQSNTNTTKDIQPLVNVTYNDIECCQKTIENVTAGLNFMKQNQVDRVKEFEDQLQQVNACLSLLECQLERISAETAAALTMDEQTAAANTNNNDHKPEGKGKKKRNRKKKNQTHKTETGESKVKTIDVATDKATTKKTWATKNNESMIEQTSISAAESPFTTLQDGTVISRTTQKTDYVSAKDELSVLDDDVKSSSEAAANPKSLENILQSTSQASNGDDITSIMESLCLDPTMLLLSPHGMAIDCSPCQLEAMQSILSHQLKAVKEAQQIQSRLLEDK